MERIVAILDWLIVTGRLTPKEIAASIGVAPSQISRWRVGARPSPDARRRLEAFVAAIRAAFVSRASLGGNRWRWVCSCATDFPAGHAMRALEVLEGELARMVPWPPAAGQTGAEKSWFVSIVSTDLKGSAEAHLFQSGGSFQRGFVVLVDSRLKGGDIRRVLATEFGHVIDQLEGALPSEPRVGSFLTRVRPQSDRRPALRCPCGTRLELQWKFCPSCGCEVPNA